MYKRRISVILTLSICLLTALPAHAQDPIRRVYVPHFTGEIRWAEAGIFWFGRVDPPDAPGLNYVDVRVAYNEEELVLYANVEDYHVWYNPDATPSSDLTQYDALAVHLDTDHDRATTPQEDDYLFLSGLCLFGCGDRTDYRRDARGNGNTWNWDWSSPLWYDDTYSSWITLPAFNGTPQQFDFGWWSVIHIPWETLNLSGPPPQGTTWGLGVRLFDRDEAPPAGTLSPESWPTDLSPTSPATWGELTFGLSQWEPQPGIPEGTTVIRRGLPNSTVEDGWVGGGGTCTGGHEGDPEHDNYGTHPNLYVENQRLIADFTCFSKSFVRFHLDPIPPGKVILSATVTLHHWSNAKPSEAQPSLIWLFETDGGWTESTLTWNHSPLARYNLSAIWVYPLTEFPGYPGIPYQWDATEAVARAYAAGEPVNLGFYTADTNFHSSKYFYSSDAGDFTAEGRPTLTIVWGSPLATLTKQVTALNPTQGSQVTYTLSLLGNAQTITVTDDLPPEVSAPGPIQVTGGPAASYDTTHHRLTWIGTPATGTPVTITFPVTVLVSGPRAIHNTAVITDTQGHTSSDSATFIVDAYHSYMPCIFRYR